MMPAPPPAKHFEDRLLCELRDIVAAQQATDPLAHRSGPRMRSVATRRIVLAPVALAALAAGMIVALGHDGSTAAYAVESHGDGTVTVEIRSLRDAAGLQSRLRGVGVPAMVDYVPDGKACREPRFDPASGGVHTVTSGIAADGSERFTISRNALRPGQTLVLTTTVTPVRSGMNIATAQGPVAPCRLIDAPPASAIDTPIDPQAPTSGGHHVTEGNPYSGVAK